MTASMKRVLVALHVPDRTPDLCLYARSIVENMSASPWFPKPVPPLTEVTAARVELEEAETAALTREKGLKDKRNEKRAVLVGLLKQLKAYVEAVANLDPENGPSIVETSGMSVVTPVRYSPQAFDVRHAKVSGSVWMVSKAGPKGCTYYRQMSRDGGSTWEDLEPVKQAKSSVSGLVPGKRYWFRQRILTRRGLGDWCSPASIIVL